MSFIRIGAAIIAAVLTLAPSAKAADVICYNCPPEWADWASMLKAIKTDLNYDIPHDNKNSGQALAQILAEKANPVGDIGYFGVTFGMKAKAQDALQPYKPAHSEQVDGRTRFGLGLRVVDSLSGTVRDTTSVSGGEAFCCALALALGLARQGLSVAWVGPAATPGAKCRTSTNCRSSRGCSVYNCRR